MAGLKQGITDKAKTTKSKTGLGRGISALLDNPLSSYQEHNEAVLVIDINDIRPNSNQPRKTFREESLQDLAASIEANGIIQPLIVTKSRSGRGYELVAGERRWRAARLAGLNEVPAIVRELSTEQVMQQALIENIQREDLNPIEEAMAYQNLQDSYHMTQEELSKILGKSRSAIANTMRLTKLPQEIQIYLAEGRLSEGHARSLITIPNEETQIAIALKIMDRSLNVRQAEELVRITMNPPKREPIPEQSDAYKLSVRTVEKDLSKRLGTRVRLRDNSGKGQILIKYESNEDLERLLELISR